jgi:hypothetical protein
MITKENKVTVKNIRASIPFECELKFLFPNKDGSIAYGVFTRTNPKDGIIKNPFDSEFSFRSCLFFGTSSNTRVRTTYWMGYELVDRNLESSGFFITNEICGQLKQHRKSNTPDPTVLKEQFSQNFDSTRFTGKANLTLLLGPILNHTQERNRVLISLGQRGITPWSDCGIIMKKVFGEEDVPVTNYKLLTEVSSHIRKHCPSLSVVPRLAELSDLVFFSD